MIYFKAVVILAAGLAGVAVFAAAEEFLTPLSTFKDCDHCPEMVVIPAGNFLVGSAADEPSSTTWEEPQHEVTFARPFAIGKYEVTFGEWDACVSAGGCVGPETGDHGWGRGRRPAILFTWEEATSYADWLTAKTGRRYRLPSEAEWEYAARAGTRTAFATGRTISSDQANFDGTRPLEGSAPSEFRQQTLPVGSFPSNAFGLHDMHGNVQEFAEDCWNESYEGAHADGSAWIDGECKFRAMRGGHWRSGASMLRSAMRTRVYPNYRRPTIGFRVAADLDH